MPSTLFIMLCLLAAPVWADSQVLRSVTVCPPDQNLLKSQTVTLTESTLIFDIVSGPWRISAGYPPTARASFPVVARKKVGLPWISQGIEVTYTIPADPTGRIQAQHTLTLYKDSIENDAGEVMKAEYCH